jgi:hypothetical protein
MKVVVYKSQLEEGDNKLEHIERIIESKRRFLLDKKKSFNELVKTNHYLSEVKDDYQRYYNYIVQEKQNQIKALNILDTYISDLARSGELTKQNINDTKYEQKRILNEIENIKNNLNSLINES